MQKEWLKGNVAFQVKETGKTVVCAMRIKISDISHYYESPTEKDYTIVIVKGTLYSIDSPIKNVDKAILAT